MMQYDVCTSLIECFNRSAEKSCNLRELVAVVTYTKLSGVEELARLLACNGSVKLEVITDRDFYLIELDALCTTLCASITTMCCEAFYKVVM